MLPKYHVNITQISLDSALIYNGYGQMVIFVIFLFLESVCIDVRALLL